MKIMSHCNKSSSPTRQVHAVIWEKPYAVIRCTPDELEANNNDLLF